MEQEIDLVVPWVNGDDPAWQKQREYYKCNEWNVPSYFYRDWGLMRYWFRGVEKNLPWIHLIHFVTWGHIPSWLNTKHSKLRVVKHEDYIPSEFRPTFSANPIELNLQRINELSEQFIYANDDTFFIGKMEPTYYFQKGMPCDCLCLRPITETCTNRFGHILWNNISCINRHFDLKSCIEHNKEKWFNALYPTEVITANKLGEKLHYFPGFRDEHLPIPFLKSTFEEVWEKEGHLLRQTCNHKFRSIEDVSNWLMRYWQLAKGDFVPRAPLGKSVSVTRPLHMLRDTILNPQNPVICLNEGTGEIDFMKRSVYLRSLFEIILPEMSSFELY